MNGALPSSVHLIEQSDYWRAPALIPAQDESIPGYKEWQHFVIFGQGWVLVFNLNIDGLPHPTGRYSRSSHPARAVTIFSAAQWSGQVDRCGDTELRLGSLDARFGDAGMRWRSGCYEIWQHQAGIKFEITLRPAAIPSLTHNIRLAQRSHLSWCLVPRLLASGWVDVDGERHEFDERGAYHDHNWGRFNWGRDFSWDWGCAVPEDPHEDWTLVFARMNSADRHRTTATSAFLLERGQHIRYFRNAEVGFSNGEGSHDPPAGRIPPAAALLLSDTDQDVPQVTHITAQRDNEWLRAEINTDVRGQVLVPSDTDVRRVVRINEATTRTHVTAQCAGRSVDFSGPGLLEVVRG